MPLDPLILREARQVLTTDRLLGLDWVPLADTAVELPEPAPRLAPKPVPSAAKIRLPPVAIAASPPLDARPILRDGRSAEVRAAELDALRAEVTAWVESNWPRDGWRRVVFGEGDPMADLMFIGEGPGADEDEQGRPFVGRAGQLLDQQIKAMALQREQVYIGNIAKTRPPGNRVPTPDEADRWLPWLHRQIEIIQPRAIVALGATASKYLLADPKLAITRERGTWKSFRGIPLMPTFHPAYLLRSYTVDNRRRVWDDLKKVLEQLGLPNPEKK